jgi:hypothetical protein
VREVGIRGYTERESLVQRRPATRLASGELSVQASRVVRSHPPRLTSLRPEVRKEVPRHGPIYRQRRSSRPSKYIDPERLRRTSG